MRNSFRIDDVTAEEWTQYGASFACNNIYQTWSYGEAHSQGLLCSVSRAILFQGERPLVMAQFRIARIPLLGIGTATACWGPLWRYDEDVLSAEEHLGEFLREVKAEYGAKRGLQVRFDPRSTFSVDQDTRLVQVFQLHGFGVNAQTRAYRTIVLDMRLPLNVLHANLDNKWRRELGYSEKEKLQAEVGTSVELFDRFHRLYNEMWANKTFVTGVDIQSIRRTQCTAMADQRLLIWIVQHNGEDIGAGVFSLVGNTVLYLLGASSPQARRKTNPGYFIVWASIVRAHELGLRWFDLGGITDVPDSGVDRFKTRMNGTYTMFPGRLEVRRGIVVGTLIDVGIEFLNRLRKLL